MSLSDTVKSIHRLAVLRDDPFGRDTTSIVISPEGHSTPGMKGEVSDNAENWMAQTYRGKGQWGNLVGEGATPEAALGYLLDSLRHAHVAVDERRAEALSLSGGAPPKI